MKLKKASPVANEVTRHVGKKHSFFTTISRNVVPQERCRSRSGGSLSLPIAIHHRFQCIRTPVNIVRCDATYFAEAPPAVKGQANDIPVS